MSTEIVIISPYDVLTEKISRVVINQYEDVEVYTRLYDQALELARKLKGEGTRVVISRAGNAVYLKEHLDIPIIDIQHVLGDYINAIKRFIRIDGLIAICFRTTIEDIEVIKKVTNLEIKQYVFQTLDEAPEKVKEAINDGAKFGVGGSYVGHLCEDIDIQYEIVESSKEAIIHSIETAKDIIKVQKEEEAKLEKYKLQMKNYQAVVDLSTNAVLSLDDNFKVTLMNEVAEKLLKIPFADAKGKHVSFIFSDLNLDKIINSGNGVKDYVFKANGNLISLNSMPLIMKEQIAGAVITFQDILALRESERKVRQALSDKGLVAKYNFEDIKTQNNEFEMIKTIAKGYAKSDSSILLTGESGTGKELFAQSIHNYSARANFPFVAINCAALPLGILESELFGYEEGAFTGGRKGGKIGLFELGHGGTIFLDEIGDMPISIQAQLLRVLQEKQIRRLGSDKIIPVDVRVISATNKNLYEEVKKGDFRHDLFYRLNVLNIELLPLRDRKEDVEVIGMDILEKIDSIHVEENILQWEEILRIIKNSNLAGNVRELNNLLERSMVILKDSIIPFSDYKKLLIATINKNEAMFKVESDEKAQTEKERILDMLDQCNWSKQDASEKLGISRSTLWRKMKEYRLE